VCIVPRDGAQYTRRTLTCCHNPHNLNDVKRFIDFINF
jgi:hypothetical protein